MTTSSRLRNLEAAEQSLVGDGDPNGVANAAEGVRYWDYTNDTLYANTDGATAWQIIGGGGGVPLNGQFLVLALSGALTSERRFVDGDGLHATDGGPNADYTLDVDVSDFAGAGLEDDGAENLRIAAAAAGDGLQGGSGAALAVDVSDFAGTGLEDDGAENLRIAASAAGDGLTGGAGVPLAVGAGYAMAVAADALHLALDTILLHHGGIITGEYATLALAIAAVAAHDTLFVPSGTWAGDITVPANVTVHGLSQANTILSGQIILSDGTRVEDLSITRTANDATTLVGVYAPSLGTAYLHNVKVSVTQNGAGSGVGIFTSSRGGDLEVHGGEVYGSTADIA